MSSRAAHSMCASSPQSSRGSVQADYPPTYERTGQAEEDRMKRGLGLLVTGMLLVTACSGTTPTSAPTGTATATGTTATATGTPAGASGTPASSASSAPSGQTLVVWTRNYTVDPVKPSPYKDAKTKFEAAHPGWTVELSGV